MDVDKALASDPGEEYRGFRMRCLETGRLAGGLVLYAADLRPETDEARQAFGQATIALRSESFAETAEQARQDWFRQCRARIDVLLRMKG